MPERIQVVTRITEELLDGPVIWNGLTGTVREGQSLSVNAFAPRQARELTQQVWDVTEEKADELYEVIVRSIDWARIIGCGFRSSP